MPPYIGCSAHLDPLLPRSRSTQLLAEESLKGIKEEAPQVLDNKLTASAYFFSSNNVGADINLRHSFPNSTAWLGAYRDREGFQQIRAGWEYDWRNENITLIPSFQAATRGFLGYSIYSELGGQVYVIAGFGRTNLRPYWNLNFDPNDAIQIGAGFKSDKGYTVSLFTVRDDRLGTGQTNSHLVFRSHLAQEHRITLDLLRKQGYGDDGTGIRSWSFTTTYDWPRWFLRAAVDPHVNYTADRQVRLALGTRF